MNGCVIFVTEACPNHVYKVPMKPTKLQSRFGVSRELFMHNEKPAVKFWKTICKVMASGLLALSQFSSWAQAPALNLSGDKALIAQTRDGQRIRIGSVNFTPAEAGQSRVRVQMDHHAMRDYFLSMREFKCLPAAAEVSCYVPYPYANSALVSAQDLQWLNHHTLFLYKRPADFGANLWNGIIFRWSLTATGLEGLPQAVDLNAISAPPKRLDVPPYAPQDSEPFAAGARWITRLLIE